MTLHAGLTQSTQMWEPLNVRTKNRVKGLQQNISGSCSQHEHNDPLIHTLSKEASASVGTAHRPLLGDCSHCRISEDERQNWPLPEHEKVGGWLRDVQAEYGSESDGLLSYPTPPAASRKDHSGYGRQRLGLRVWPSALAQLAIAAGYAHQERGALYAQGLLGPAPESSCVIMPQESKRRPARRLRVLQYARHTKAVYGHADSSPSEV